LDAGVEDTAPVGSFTRCVGGFPGLLDMSGNVNEWENSCYAASDGGGPDNDQCFLRGGGYAHNLLELQCEPDIKHIYIDYRKDQRFDVGFRCCR